MFRKSIVGTVLGILLFSLIPIGVVLAGTATYATQLDFDNIYRYHISDNQTLLNGAITADQTTITVDSTEAFTTSGYLQIENETIKYTGKSATTFTGLTRGSEGSIKASHADGTPVNQSAYSSNLAGDTTFDYFDDAHDGQVNVANSERQPGSSFKPVVYATAFKNEKYNPAYPLYDLKTDFGGGYTPENYNRAFFGPMTMRNALAQSRNVPAVKTLYLAGMDNTLKTAKSMGITTLLIPKDTAFLWFWAAEK